MSKNREKLRHTGRWVIKIGSALVTNDGKGLKQDSIDDWASQVAELRQRGIDCILVSSGSVAEGISRLGWSQRPHELHNLQAAAAVGQMGLIKAYESSFRTFNLRTAQILLTHDDITHRQRYLNARNTLRTLLELGVVPVVNENDTVANDELRFGDNDSLAGMVANLIDADLLVILTDQMGLYDADPRNNPGARLISEAEANDPALLEMAGGGGLLGRGGMRTKISAAQLATRSGTPTVIAAGSLSRVLLDIHDGKEIGTLLSTEQLPLVARKRWLAASLMPKGSLILDEGAVAVLKNSGKSLLAVGVKEVEGRFGQGELVRCLDAQGHEIARGLVNYSADETRLLKGKPSSQIESLLGYGGEQELIHRDNMVLS